MTTEDTTAAPVADLAEPDTTEAEPTILTEFPAEEAVDASAPEDTADASDTDTSDDERVFTQEEVNEFVAKRVARLKQKHALALEEQKTKLLEQAAQAVLEAQKAMEPTPPKPRYETLPAMQWSADDWRQATSDLGYEAARSIAKKQIIAALTHLKR